MKVINTDLRAVIERVTELEWHSEGAKIRLFIFENLGRNGNPCKQWIQNWECDDVTNQFSHKEQTEIFEAVNQHWKNR